MNPQDDWRTEIIKRLPWSGTFLTFSFLFFKFTKYEVAGWVCLVVAIIALFIVIRVEHYEKIIDRQEKEIEKYSKSAMKAHQETTKTISEFNGRISKTIDLGSSDSTDVR